MSWGTADYWSRSGPRGHWMVNRGGAIIGALFIASCDACTSRQLEFCPNMTAAKNLAEEWDRRHAHAFEAVAPESSVADRPSST